jgi:molecular chaperone GrpE
MSDNEINSNLSPETGRPSSTTTAAEQDAAPRTDAVPTTEQLLKAADLQAAEHHDAWLRAKAEAENIRRRAQEDIAKAGKYAVEKFAESMLPVKDSLEATLVAESATLESLRAGVDLTLKQLVAGLQSAGISEVNPDGDKFDPHRHQAISAIESEGEPNRVIKVLQKGYLIHDRVLRPALVVVSRAKEG